MASSDDTGNSPGAYRSALKFIDTMASSDVIVGWISFGVPIAMLISIILLYQMSRYWDYQDSKIEFYRNASEQNQELVIKILESPNASTTQAMLLQYPGRNVPAYGETR